MIRLDDFSGGQNTYKDDDQLSRKEAVEAENCFVGDGALTPAPHIKSGEPSGIYEDRFNDDDNCGYVVYNGTEYNGCDLSGLGLPQPAAPIVRQGLTPAVIGPSEDGSGNFNSAGDWEQTEFQQTNVWTAVINDTAGVFGDPGTTTVTATDSWVVCDTPEFNITPYYALLNGNPALEKPAPEVDAFGCVIGGTGSDYQTGPGSDFVPKFFTQNTSYAVSFYNEDWDIESTISDITEFEHVPVITHRRWTYGPLQGDTEGKQWFPSGFLGESTVVPANSSTDPAKLRGNRREEVTYTGISHLHQVTVTLPSHHNASHTILYKREGGSLTPVAMLRGGGTVTVRPDGVFEDNTGEDLSTNSQLVNRRPVFTEFVGPPSSLNGIAVNSIGIMVGFSGDTLHISEPNSGFHLWNPDARFTLSYTPVSVHAIYNEFLVTTTGKPLKITGSNPETMIPIELPSLEFNVARKSAVDAGGAILWAGPTGVNAYNGSRVQTVTSGRLSKQDWLSIIDEPDDLVGVAAEDVYILFHTNGALIVDFRPESPSITTWDITATKAVYDIEAGWVYISNGRKFRMHDTLTRTWASQEGKWKTGRLYVGSVNQTFSWMRVHASGTVEITIINDENEQSTYSVTDSMPLRVGMSGQAVRGEWIQITATFHNRIKSIELASSVKELHQ